MTPCRRSVGSDGSLAGYIGGINAKMKLLELEGADLFNLFAPSKGTALQRFAPKGKAQGLG